MSNANKHSNTSAASMPSTLPPTPASSQAKPAAASNDAKPPAGGGASVIPVASDASTPSPNPTNGQATTPATPATPAGSASATGTGASDDTSAGSAPDSESDPLMFCIVVGPVRQFKTAAKAEEYLNGSEAPADYTVIRGRVATTKRKITLRG